MKFDSVHSVQQAYRELLMAMAKPGTVFDFGAYCSELDFVQEAYKGAQILALMLLDQEVTLATVAPENVDLASRIQALTYSRQVSVDEADYVFIHKDIEDTHVRRILENCRTGTLHNPHEGATVVIERSPHASQTSVTLSGPGIESFITLALPLGSELVEARERINGEYPLGVDMIVVSENHHVMCLPRTTNVQLGGENYGLCSC